MKIALLVVGAVKKGPLKEAREIYIKRLKRYINTDEVIAREGDSSGRSGKAGSIDKEAERILDKLNPGDYVVALSEEGEQYSSKKLAKHIENLLSGQMGAKERLVFIVGGAYGLGEGVTRRADITLSLSEMTLPHEMASLVLSEQVYRAFTIMRNEPYSH